MNTDQIYADKLEAEVARLRARNAELLEALRASEPWLTAALECERWEWDGDQRFYATEGRDKARSAIRRAEQAGTQEGA